MATFNEDKKAFLTAALDTPLDAVCVKRRGKAFKELVNDSMGHGILVSPVVVRGPLALLEFKETFGSFHSEVIVRGHGWAGETKFVWTGTSDEFNETWEID